MKGCFPLVVAQFQICLKFSLLHNISDVAKFQNDILHGIEVAVDEEHSHFITHSDTMTVIGIVTSPETCELNQTENQSNSNFLASSIIELNRPQWGSIWLKNK